MTKEVEALIADVYLADANTRRLRRVLAALRLEVLAQRCTVREHRNLLTYAPDQPHEGVSAGYTDMIYAAPPNQVGERRRAFIGKWRPKRRAVADSLEEAGGRLFTVTPLPLRVASGARQQYSCHSE